MPGDDYLHSAIYVKQFPAYKVVYLYIIISGKHRNDCDFDQSTGCGGPAAGIHSHDACGENQRKCQDWYICFARSALHRLIQSHARDAKIIMIY